MRMKITINKNKRADSMMIIGLLLLLCCLFLIAKASITISSVDFPFITWSIIWSLVIPFSYWKRK